MSANERRLKVRDKYREIMGRNHYSQARRNYCYKKYSDGKYYSDCSSSVSYAYREAGESFGILNTTGMWASPKLRDVPVVIEKGQIKNPEALRIGDMLLFAGGDAGRRKWGYVGHVEMVGEISGSGQDGAATKVTLYGHGSGYPKKHDMTAYCRTRYNSKTAETPLGRKLLIRVLRFIPDDGDAPGAVEITGGTVNVRLGPGTGYGILGVARRGERFGVSGMSGGWYRIDWRGRPGWVSGKYAAGVGEK